MSQKLVDNCKVCNESFKNVERYTSYNKLLENGISLYNTCKKCEIKRRKEYHENHKEQLKIYNKLPEIIIRKKKWQLMYKYHLSMESYADMLLEQNFKCKICLQPFNNTPEIDHDHITGENRGLLCHNCNVDVGYYENRDLVKIRKYLEGI